MNLDALQNAFQAGILSGDPVIPASIEDGPRQDRAARFRAYYDAYRIRLAECLSNEYSALRDRLGDEDFGALIEAYIETQPSRHPAAQDYCRGLPNFMRATAPWRARRDIVDFAAFERQLSLAFDAADAPSLAIASLAHVAPADWPALTFAFHPSVEMLDLLQGTAQAYARTRGAEDAEGSQETPRRTPKRSCSGATTAASSIARSTPARGWRWPRPPAARISPNSALRWPSDPPARM